MSTRGWTAVAAVLVAACAAPAARAAHEDPDVSVIIPSFALVLPCVGEQPGSEWTFELASTDE